MQYEVKQPVSKLLKRLKSVNIDDLQIALYAWIELVFRAPAEIVSYAQLLYRQLFFLGL